MLLGLLRAVQAGLREGLAAAIILLSSHVGLREVLQVQVKPVPDALQDANLANWVPSQPQAGAPATDQASAAGQLRASPAERRLPTCQVSDCSSSRKQQQ